MSNDEGKKCWDAYSEVNDDEDDDIDDDNGIGYDDSDTDWYCIDFIVNTKDGKSTTDHANELMGDWIKPGQHIFADRGTTCRKLVQWCYERDVFFTGTCTFRTFLQRTPEISGRKVIAMALT